ncbi:MAG: TnpV protein [Oscillospiraceae bacterium]|nr:TnpV protein [Oscillospiraceae bacterium]MBQ9045816.1 TnpV protein [Oscillospiraceae bacterium]
MTSGRLTAHLMEIEQTARSRTEQLIVQMAKSEGMTEELKVTDQMKWVGLMNSIRQAEEEIVLLELVFS